ncbi:hypothetical protein Tco_0832029 [Tanacetum coccineum]
MTPVVCATAPPRGGRSGRRTGRGGGRTGGQTSDQGNGRIDETNGELGGQGNDRAQVGSQSSDQGNGRNQNGNAINENIQGDVRNVIVNNDRRGCTYKEFLACNPKEYDSKGGAIVYTRWIEKMESVQDMSGCGDNQKKLETRFWNHAMVGAGHAAYPDRFQELARLILYLVTPENKRIERNRSLKKNTEKRGNSGEPSKDRNVKDDFKRTRTVNAFATTVNPVRREYTGMTPK